MRCGHPSALSAAPEVRWQIGSMATNRVGFQSSLNKRNEICILIGLHVLPNGRWNWKGEKLPDLHFKPLDLHQHPSFDRLAYGIKMKDEKLHKHLFFN